MLLDDSVELEYDEYSANAVSLPLNWDIELSKIWIPSSLLPSRKKSINPNENKPFIFYTLEKPDESQSFSVYAEEYSQHHEPQTSSAILSGISSKLKNDNIDEIQTQQVSSLSQNAVECDAMFIINNKEENSPLHPVISSELNYSLKDERCFSVTSNDASRGKNKPESCAMQETSNTKASFEELARRMAEILPDDEPLKIDCHHETNQVSFGSALYSLSSSIKDSLEELYYSEEEENELDTEEYKIENIESESSEKKYTRSIYTENSYVQEQLPESFVNNLNDPKQAKNNNPVTGCKLFQEMENIPLESQKIHLDNVFDQTELADSNKIETSMHSKNLEQEQLHCEKSENPIENILEFFPIAYKRPPLQEQTNKTKPQKEKKKTKRSKNNIPLVDLFQKDEIDRFQVPEFDEFYENLIRQGKCQPLNQETEINTVPSTSVVEKILTNIDDFPTINLPEIPQTTLFWESADKSLQNEISNPQSSYPQEIIKNEEKNDSNVSLDTIVIDKIPSYISKENIENFILGFGELKNLTLEQHGKFQRAKLQMDFNSEVDWIIDCLNDSQPFGGATTELIKCYRLT